MKIVAAYVQFKKYTFCGMDNWHKGSNGEYEVLVKADNGSWYKLNRLFPGKEGRRLPEQIAKALVDTYEHGGFKYLEQWIPLEVNALYYDRCLMYGVPNACSDDILFVSEAAQNTVDADLYY